MTTAAEILDALLADATDLTEPSRTAMRTRAQAMTAIAQERREISEAHAAEKKRHETVQAELAVRTLEMRKGCPYPMKLREYDTGPYDMRGTECGLCGKEMGR